MHKKFIIINRISGNKGVTKKGTTGYLYRKQFWLFKVVLKIVISGMLLSLIISCNHSKNVDSKSPESLKPELTDEFLIMAYSGPPPGEINMDRFREIAGAGIEILVPGNGVINGAQNLEVMDLAEKAGIRVVPFDIRVLALPLNPGISPDTIIIQEVTADYKDHPAFAGYVISDEPSATLFPALKRITGSFRKEDPLHEPVINLLPSYGSPVQLGFDDYRKYITSFIETLDPGLLSYDNYPLREGVTWYDAWYSDLAVVREETQKVSIPFVLFVQSEGIRGGLRVPNRAEILWQVNTALAYGARGFGWFCYWTPQPDQGFPQLEGGPPPLVEAHYNAMIDLKGNRTEVYDFVREANFYLKKAGKELYSWTNTDVARYEEGKIMEGGSSPVLTPTGEQANLVIGTYQKDNRSRIIISNSRCEEPAAFSIQVSPKWTSSGVFTSIEAFPAGDATNDAEWNLNPGGSVILEFQTD